MPKQQHQRWHWLIADLVAAVFILTFTVPWQPAEEAPIGAFDYSWMLVLHDAVATGRQFGTQIILPQGPTGFIGNSVYDPRTYPWLITARSVLALLAFFSLRQAARKWVKNPLAALGWMLAIILLLGKSPDHFFPGCAILLVFDYFLVSDRKFSFSSLGLIVVLAASSLIKVNQPFFAIAVLGLLMLDQIRQRNVRFLLVPVVYLALVLFFYLLTRQQWSSLGAFLWGWGQVTLGHADAVGLPGPWTDPVAYLVVVALMLALIGRYEWQTRRWAGALPLAGVAAVLLLLYKHSFMRHDLIHAHMGPMVAFAAAILYLPVLYPTGGRVARGLYLLTVSLAGMVVAFILAETPQDLPHYIADAPFHCATNINAALSHITDPGRLYRRWQADRQKLRDDNPLPLEKIVGTVDVYPHRQDVVLAYNLNYQPRPVISSLVATSTTLADVNARHLLGPSAPQTVLFDIELVDNNFPTMLDGESLPELLTRYDLIDSSNAMLVMRRSAQPRSYHFTPLVTLTGQFNEPLKIPPPTDAPIWAKVRFTKRLAGRVIAALYKPASINIVAAPSGAELGYRLLPSLAEQGFLLSPLIKDRKAFSQLAGSSWSKDLKSDTVESITLSIEDGSQEASFEPVFSVELSKLEFP